MWNHELDEAKKKCNILNKLLTKWRKVKRESNSVEGANESLDIGTIADEFSQNETQDSNLNPLDPDNLFDDGESRTSSQSSTTKASMRLQDINVTNNCDLSSLIDRIVNKANLDKLGKKYALIYQKLAIFCSKGNT